MAAPGRVLFLWVLCASLPPPLALAPSPGPQRTCASTQHFSAELESLRCYNDYSSHIRCSWRESTHTPSRAPLSLFHLDVDENTVSQCLPHGSAVPMPGGQLEVHCQYNTTFFVFGMEDAFFFGTPHSRRLSRTLSLSRLARVQAPHSLSQRATKGGGSVLHWQSPYPPSSPLYPTLNYQVNYRRLGQDWTVLAVSGKELVFKADSLVSGCWYEARVRAQGGEGLWSEWSPPVQWKTEEAAVPGPSNLQCVFDGEAAVSCSWEVKPDLAQFITYKLSYRTDPTASAHWCCMDPQAGVDSGLSTLRFSCSFSVSYPGQLLVELIPSPNTRLFRSQTNIRPTPPTHVKLQEKGEYWVLSWVSPKFRVPISFQVWYWRSDKPEEVKDYIAPGDARSHHLHRSSLLPSTSYTAQVRSIVTPPNGSVYSGPPSDWTELVHWTTHAAPWSPSILLYFLIGVCAAVLFLVLSFTFPACIRRMTVWEQSTPSPFKSKMLEEMMKNSTNDCSESRKALERATVSEIPAQESVQTAHYFLCLSEDGSQPTWLSTTEDDGSYQHVFRQGLGVGTNHRRLYRKQQPEGTPCMSLSDPVSCPEFERPKSRGVVSRPCVEAPTSQQQTLLERWCEYEEVPPAKTGSSGGVSTKWPKDELEVQHEYMDHRHLLLGPPESGMELHAVPGPLSSDLGPCTPIALSIRTVIVQQHLDSCLFPNIESAVRSTAPPSTPPAGYRETWQENVTVDHTYVSLSHS